MSLLLRGRFVGLCSSSFSLLTYSRSPSSSRRLSSMALRLPANLTHSDSPEFVPFLHRSLCCLYLKHRVPAPGRQFFSVRSVMTDLQDSSNGAPPIVEEEAAVGNMLRVNNIHLSIYRRGTQRRLMCPKCAGGASGERSLSLNISDDGFLAKWQCFRGTCGWKGHTEVPRRRMHAHFYSVQQSQVSKNELFNDSARLVDLSGPLLDHLLGLGISEQTLRRNDIKQWLKGSNNLLVFPYKEGGEIVSYRYYNHKYDSCDEKVSHKILYGLDDIKGASQVIIVGWELDKLVLEEAGYLNCVSLPDVKRTNSRIKSPERKSKGEINNFQYLLNCEDHLAKVNSFVLAIGSDDDHKIVAEELARRLGRERCWVVNWPVDEKNGALCKDVLEVFQKKGCRALQDMIINAELYPLHGLFRFSYYEKEIDDFYHERSGYEQGVSSGWKSLDPYYRVVPGELTLVTGVPSSGKSEWIDALMCNLNRSRKWTFVLCSLENQVKEHGRKLLEKYIRKPFLTALYSSGATRMNDREYETGKLWLSKTFYLIRCENDELPSVEWVLDAARSAVLRYGVQGLVIDPYNELDHQRPANMTETEYVSQMLSKIKRFAKLHDCHVWFVAHPKQLQGWKGEAPSLYDISGSAHFINKCDVGIVVHRNRDSLKGSLKQVHILVRKVRNKAAGMVGEAILEYDRITGEYRDIKD